MTSQDNVQLDGVFKFMRLVWALHHALARTSKRMLKDLGVTGPQRLVVRVVGQSPGVSAGELAEALHLHPSTITGVLRRLEDARVLVRKTDASDGRRSHFSLTALGKRIDRQQAGTVEAAVRLALKKLPKSDLEAASRVLQAIIASLE